MHIYILHWKNISQKNQHKSALNQWRNSTSDQQIINCQLVISKCCIIQKKRFSCKEPTMIIHLNIDYMVNSRIFTARKRSLRRLCFYMCLSFCPQGGSAPLHTGIQPSWTRGRHTPPKANTPETRGRHPPPPGADTPLIRHPPEQTPREQRQAPPPPAQYLLGDTGMQSCLSV